MKKVLLFIILNLLFFTGFAQLDYQSVNKHLVGQNQRPPQDTLIPPLWIGEMRIMIKGDTPYVYVCISKGLGKKWKLITSNFEVPVDTSGVYNRKSTRIAAHSNYDLWDINPTRLYLFDSLLNKYNLVGPFVFAGGLTVDTFNSIVAIGSSSHLVPNTWFGGRFLVGPSAYSSFLQLDSVPLIIRNKFDINGSGTAPSWTTQSFGQNFYSTKTYNVNTPDITTGTRGVTLHTMTIESNYNGTDFLNMRNNQTTPFRSASVRFQIGFGRTAQTTGPMYFNGGTTALESPVDINSHWTLPFNNTDSVRRVVLKGWWAHYSTSLQRGTAANNRDSIEHIVDYLSGQGVEFNNQLKTHISFYSGNESMGQQRWSLYAEGVGRKLYSQGVGIFGGDTTATAGFSLISKSRFRLDVADSTNTPMNMLTLNRTTGAVQVSSIPLFGVSGVSTLVSGTVTVNTSFVKTGSNIIVSYNTPSGTIGYLSVPSGSIVDGVSFVINSSSSIDNSTVNWWVKN